MAFLVDAYDVDEAPNAKGGVDKRTVLRLDPRLAPVKAAVLPLSKKPELQNIAHNLEADLRQDGWMIDYDEAGAIGRRYRREDEIGTPLCITVDFDTIDDNAVTIRERDTMQQERVALANVADYVRERVSDKRVRIPGGPAEITGVRGADGAVDYQAEAGEDESAPVKVEEAGGENA
jgi:glycyl-tRNA synthetase